MTLSKRDKVVELYDKPRVVYDQNKIIDTLMAEHKMTDEEAQEFFDFNIAGSYVGQQTPIYIQKA